MPILFDEQYKTFKLDTPHTSYCIGVYDGGYLVTLYYGASIPDTDLSDYYYYGGRWVSFNPTRPNMGQFSMDVNPLEYPGFGTGDFRRTAVRIQAAEGNTATDPRYVGYRIFSGKERVQGMPSLYLNDPGEADTLELLMEDAVTGARFSLFYTVFKEQDVITRFVRLTNAGTKEFKIEEICSAFTNLPSMDYSLVTLVGKWGDERNIERNHLAHGLTSLVSRRGSSSHNQNPFLALTADGSDEDHGDTYGVNFVYSGSFRMDVECDYYETTRISVGFNPEQFGWYLAPGESFDTPETVMVFTQGGLGEMSRIFHRLYNNNLLRGRYKTEKRPLLINNWEATGMDFNEEKLYDFAVKAHDMGIEMLVMDDGWFGHRDDDKSSLGDWFVDTRKLDLKSLVDRVHALGMKFGIWFEPEMISKDSTLFEAHPDWAITVPGREQCVCRTQYVIDMTRKEVRDHIFDMMQKIISENGIDYVKWDFNRNLTEVSSAALSAKHQCEMYHRFTLGTYELMGRLIDSNPQLMLENCSGGGGRFDPGMLYYSPQIWCSDNTDPIDRLDIQFGTSLVYPAATMGAHVTANERTSNYALKADVALWGSFGYELDPNVFTEEEKDMVRRLTKEYHKYYWLIHTGDLYRLQYPDEDKMRCAWAIVAPDKSEALVTEVIMRKVNRLKYRLKVKGLDPQKMYRIEETGAVRSGALLMNAGINMNDYPQDTHTSYRFHLIAE